MSTVELGANIEEVEISPEQQVAKLEDFVDTWGVSYRVSADGREIYYIRRSQPPTSDRIWIVSNWSAYVEQAMSRE
jgi:hypothetical protein